MIIIVNSLLSYYVFWLETQTNKYKEMIETIPMATVNPFINGLTVENKLTDTITCRVRKYRSAKAKFSVFAMVQLLEGAELWTKDRAVVPQDDVLLMIRLGKQIRGVFGEEPAEMTITHAELRTLKSWLEARMKHCENERETRATTTLGGIEHPKFNPDSYIGMKLLLIDIRELLIGEILEVI